MNDIKVYSVALLYQKVGKEITNNVVRAYVDEFVDGEDEYYYKANAERHWKDDPSLKELNVVAWAINAATFTDDSEKL